MVAPGTPPRPSRLEELAFRCDVEPDWLRWYLRAAVDEAYDALLAQVLRELEESSLQRVESQAHR